jgi:O-antigen/teichoic acid export membrane protein
MPPSSVTAATLGARLRPMIAAGLPKHLGDLVVLATAQLASRAIGFVVFAVLARRLAPEDYGSVEYVVGLASFFVMAVDCGLATIAVRRIGAEPSELPALAARIPMARLVIALIAAPLLVAAMVWFGPASAPLALTVLFAASLLLAPWNQEWLLQATGRMNWVAFTQIWRAVVFAAVVLLFVRGPVDVVNVGWAEMVSALAATLFYVGLQQAKITPLRLRFEIASLVGLAGEGVSVGLANFVWSGAQYMPLLLVGSMVGGADVGWFGAAQRLMLAIAAFSMVYHFSLFPALTRAAAVSDETLAHLLQRSSRVTAWAAIGLALGITLGARPVMGSVFGEPFARAATALAVMIWVIPVTILSGHSRWALIVKGQQVGVLHAQIAGLVTVVATGVPLVMWLGANGAALAAVFASVAVWAVAHTRVSGLVSLPAMRMVVKPALCALALGTSLYWMQPSPMVRVVAGLVLYVALAPVIDSRILSDFSVLADSKTRRQE